MQESRLFRILYELLANGKTTAPALARKLEVSVRTIYRDIDALSACGVPIYTIPGKSGGIALLDGYTIPKALLSDDERAQILAALQGIDIMVTAAKNQNARCCPCVLCLKARTGTSTDSADCAKRIAISSSHASSLCAFSPSTSIPAIYRQNRRAHPHSHKNS